MSLDIFRQFTWYFWQCSTLCCLLVQQNTRTTRYQPQYKIFLIVCSLLLFIAKDSYPTSLKFVALSCQIFSVNLLRTPSLSFCPRPFYYTELIIQLNTFHSQLNHKTFNMVHLHLVLKHSFLYITIFLTVHQYTAEEGSTCYAWKIIWYKKNQNNWMDNKHEENRNIQWMMNYNTEMDRDKKLHEEYECAIYYRQCNKDTISVHMNALIHLCIYIP